MRRLLVIALALCAGFAAAPHRASAAPCKLLNRGTLWIDFGDTGTRIWQTFARPGVIAAASNYVYPELCRSYGAKTCQNGTEPSAKSIQSVPLSGIPQVSDAAAR